LWPTELMGGKGGNPEAGQTFLNLVTKATGN
jgi:hypothetical protein